MEQCQAVQKTENIVKKREWRGRSSRGGGWSATAESQGLRMEGVYRPECGLSSGLACTRPEIVRLGSVHLPWDA
ncbi:hypothetical protein CRG98_008769 [Punica granatum]|uniref:Uncharacterized protein n=1 Tax=Punica granatum TaxID=22663 RepID=A0A2I0KQV1_PUNGR|nr:hypothetical protein CRG98_008769 [Punica granatum]